MLLKPAEAGSMKHLELNIICFWLMQGNFACGNFAFFYIYYSDI